MSVYLPKASRESNRLAMNRPTFTGQARPKYVTRTTNVYEAALDRIRWLFDEFDNKVLVSNSGGKDSTCVLELAAMVNRERGYPRGPLVVQWLDQECEFQTTVDYQRYLMYERDDIDFRWYQIPFKLENSTNMEDEWLEVWDPRLAPVGDEPSGWAREKEPTSIHINATGEWEFGPILRTLASDTWDGCLLDGIRSEESPARRLTTTSTAMYKWVTWSAMDYGPKYANDPSKIRYRFHPIYDWRHRDVWKAIDNNSWRYNEHYNDLFRYGMSGRNMRVSNYHHHEALGSLHWLQEVEPETWQRATQRLSGISTWGHIGKDQMPRSLPYMFASWDEYLTYLIENLIEKEDKRAIFRKFYARLLRACGPYFSRDDLAQEMVISVIGNDFYGVRVKNFIVNHSKPRNWEALNPS